MPTGVYKRNKPEGNEGLTKVTDPRVNSAHWIPSEQTRELWSQQRKGRKWTPEQIARVKEGIAKAGGAWNKGLTKDTHPGLAIASEKVSKSLSGRKHTEETKKKMSAAHKGRFYGNRENLRIKNKGQVPWNKGLSKENSSGVLSQSIKIAEKWKAADVKSEWLSKLRRASVLRPNKLESKVDSILQSEFPGQWKYVGDGSLIIEGMIPDFVNVNGLKAVIEVDGSYWHKDKNPEERILKFKEYGYHCLVLDESPINSDSSYVVSRVTSFAGGLRHG